MNTDATNRAARPRCHQPIGAYCRRPSGREADEPHMERLAALEALPDYNPKDYEAPLMTFDQVLKSLGS